MKKIISVVLVLALSLCMGIFAYAADIDTSDGSTTTDVKATYVPGDDTVTVYSVDVTWGSMEFAYTDVFEGTWNTETHEYDDATAAAWSCATDANKITVINHSNTNINVSLDYRPAEDFSGITGTLSKTTIDLYTASGTNPVDAPNDSAYLTLAGNLDSSVEASTIIGSVTVTLN